MEITFSNGIMDWPAWVQAVGSVAAIFVAILVDQGAARRARRDARDARREYIALVLGIARRAVADIVTAAEGLSDKSMLDGMRGGDGPNIPRTSRSVLVIRKLDLNRMPTAEVAVAVAELRRLSGWGKNYVTAAVRDWSTQGSLSFDVQEALGEWAMNARAELAVIEAEAKRQGVKIANQAST